MGVTLKILTHRREHYAGDAIQGTVEMEIASANPEGPRAHQLKLKLVGHVRIVVQVVDSEGMDYSSTSRIDSNVFLSREIVLGSFAGRVATGAYTFPFSFSVASLSLPSTEETGAHGYFSIQYSLKARLYQGPVQASNDRKSELRLKILGRPWEAVPAVPMVLGPTTSVVRHCCSASGIITIGCRVDRSEVRTGEAIQVDVVIRNESSVAVHAMYIKIKQLATWNAHSHKSSKKRTLASVVVRRSQLGGAEQGAAEAEGQSAASIAEATRQDMRRQLAAGNGTRYRITVPRSTALSFETPNIQVRHWLSVKLKPLGFNSSPQVSTPVKIRPPEMVSAGRAVQGEQRSAEDAPHSSTVVEVGANGDDTPETVSQTATAMSYSIVRPQSHLQAQ